jgi:hypothetical protein
MPAVPVECHRIGLAITFSPFRFEVHRSLVVTGILRGRVPADHITGDGRAQSAPALGLRQR